MRNTPRPPHGPLARSPRPSPGGRRVRGPAGRLQNSPRRRQQPAEVGVVVLLGAEQREQLGAVEAQRLTQQLPVHPAAAAACPGTGSGTGNTPPPGLTPHYGATRLCRAEGAGPRAGVGPGGRSAPWGAGGPWLGSRGQRRHRRGSRPVCGARLQASPCENNKR